MRVAVDYLFTYYPKYTGLSDKNSRILLDFKRFSSSAKVYVKNLLNNWIAENIDRTHVVCTVPSCKASKTNHITVLMREICQANPLLINGTNCIRKRFDTNSFCHSNYRNAGKLRRSLEISQNLRGKHILLVDDITSSGLSMAVLKDMLYQNDALSVTCLAIGQTYKLY